MVYRNFLLVSIWAVQAATAQSLGTVIGPGTAPASYNGVPISNAFQNPVWLATAPTGALYLTSNMQAHLVDGMLLQLPPTGALTARLNTPVGNQIATDLAGNVYSISLLQSCVKRNLLAFAGVCNTGFGDPPLVSSGDGGPAIRAQLARPTAIAADGKGNVFIWEDFTSRLRRVGPDGNIATVLEAPTLTGKHLAIGPDNQLYVGAYNPSVVGPGAIYRLTGAQLTRVVALPADGQSEDFAIDSEGNFYASDCSTCDSPTVVRIDRQGVKTRILVGSAFKGRINALAFDRSGNLFIATGIRDRDGQGQGFEGEARVWKATGVGRPLPACTYSISPATLTAPAEGAVLTIAVNVDASCAWTPQPGAQSVGELTIAPIGAPFLSGPASLTVTVRPNTGADRNLDLVIGDRTFTIRQAGGATNPQPPGPTPPAAQPGCTFTLSPTSLLVETAGINSANIRVSTQPECRYAITLGAPWISLTGAAIRQGDSTVTISVSANTQTTVRSAVITVGNVSFAVGQNTATTGGRPGIRGIINGANYSTTISANSFASILGSSLTFGTASWDNAIRDGVFPTTLNDVRVRVNGLDTYPVYVSPTQINFLTPPNSFSGTVPVEVRYANTGPSIAFVNYKPAAPGFFGISGPGGVRYPVAYIANTDTLVAPVGAFPGADSRPARPGDVITLYATGLGPTDPPLTPGRVLTAPLPVADLASYRVQIGNASVPSLDYAGMTYVGLYQINLTVPAGVGTGVVPFAFHYGAVNTVADGLRIATEEQ